MATKRRLYQPAPKTIAGSDKKTRKPLVQGRLFTDPTTLDVQKPLLTHGQSLVQGECQDDPTMLPVKSLPVLTETGSSRPEPLECLDLSDTDTDMTYGARPQPVMVFDASALGDPSAGAAVDVVMAYEQSPARIICHTPGKLQRSLCQERAADISAFCAADGPGISVRVGRVVNVAGSTPQADHRQLGDQENLNILPETTNRSDEVSGHYSYNRGIIEQILRQELGNSNMEAISLYSESSPLTSQQPATAALSANSQGPWINQEGLACLSRNDSQTGDPSVQSAFFPRSSQVKQKKDKMNVNEKNSSFPQPKFDDSDTSVDQIPVKDSVQNEPVTLHGDYSGSETCSLHEYVTPNKPQTKPVGLHKLDLSGKPLQDTEQSCAATSTKRTKPRKVTSRYLQSSASRSTAENKLVSTSSSLEATMLKSNSRSQAAASAGSKQTREKQPVDVRAELRTRKTAPGKFSRTNNMPTNTQTQQSVVLTSSQTLGQPESPQEAIRSSHEFPNTVQKTSTPTHDQTCHLSQDIDASAIHSISAMSINTSLPGLHPAAAANKTSRDAAANKTSRDAAANKTSRDTAANKTSRDAAANKTSRDAAANNLMTQTVSNKRNTNRPHADATSSDTSQLQLDLEHTRYLQWAFMNSKVSQMLQEQEKDAAAYLHALWKVVESSRETNARLKMDVARIQQINLLETVLDKTEPDLDTVVSLLPQLEEYYLRMSSALDTTRHQLPTTDIHIPHPLQEEYEDKLETALTESQHLLTELNQLTGDQVLPLGQYLDCVEAIQKNVLSTFSELQDSQTDVAALQGLSTRLTSLSVQEMQL